MKKTFTTLLLAATLLGANAQDTLWTQYADRFRANGVFSISRFDSVEFRLNDDGVPILRMYSDSYDKGYGDRRVSSFFGTDYGNKLYLHDPGRILYKPSAFGSMDFTDEASQWCFKRSKESEHFVCFWEDGLGDNPTRFSPDNLLSSAERIWNMYVDSLGFLVPGHSKTDRYKIMLLVYETTDWVASGSGYDLMVGALNVNPWAISSRSGMTVAHEIGHTFQYLVSCDLGTNHGFNYGYGDNASGGNGWWESCANWQGYKCFPSIQFTDGEYLEGYFTRYHLNFLHEDQRYQNCFMQDYWCMKHGRDFIGRLWRESLKPEDPIEAYKRLCNLTQDEFLDEEYEGCARMATFDIDGIRQAASAKIGNFPSHLTRLDDGVTWQVDSAYCPQNYGYNILRLRNASAGTVVKAHFKGIAGAKGYRAIRTQNAGWRYGFVAMTNTGERFYSPAYSGKEETVEFEVPTGTNRLFFVVMGAPTEHWRHPWDDNVANDEQWPYQVSFEGTDRP